MYLHYSPFFHHGLFGWIFPIIGLGVFILVVFLLYKLIKNIIIGINRPNIHPTEESLKILNERLARGEISEDEYLRLKNLILKN